MYDYSRNDSIYGYAERERQKASSIIEFAGLSMDRRSHTCIFKKNEIRLTPKEFLILWQLCEAKGQIMSAEKLYSHAWDEPFYSGCSNTIMVHIRHLRQKLETVTQGEMRIKTIWSMGYRLDARSYSR